VRIVFRKSFEQDLKKVKDQTILAQVKQVIEATETVASLRKVSGVKKLSRMSGFYRIRIGDYRIGLAVDKNKVEFVRCLHRRGSYRYFP